MTLQEFYTLQEETFDSFCKTLIRNESINAHKEYAFRAQTETPLQDLSSNEQQQLAHEDTYDALATHFIVRGENVYVLDSRNLSSGHGYLVIRACELVVEGLNADEIMVTSSSALCMKVASIDGIPVGGKDQKNLKILQDAYLAKFQRETQPV